jgi:6-phosphogluconate dehydrogenase (decarboxylating)
MKVAKLSISFDSDLGDAVRGAAHHKGSSLSAWLADAAAAKLRAEALADYLEDWEAQHGELTADELADAAIELGVSLPLAARAA